jgi:hypothetical protein
MLMFGISAFLKFVCLNDRPQRTALRQRLLASGGGYDYHRSLRLRTQRYLVRGESMAKIATSIDEIARAPERNSVRIGLERLETWRSEHAGAILNYAPTKYESPGGLFKVTFTPDFGIRVGDSGVAIHVWNTARPQLLQEMAYGTLSLFRPLYEGTGNAPDDLAVLSLPDQELHRLGEAGPYAGRGADLATRVENLVREVRDDLGLPDADDQPYHPTEQP